MNNIARQNGWAFYVGDGIGVLPEDGNSTELLHWIQGFGKALADYDSEGTHPSFQAALLYFGVDAGLLEDCLQAAETPAAEANGTRWPDKRPIRGCGHEVD